jgi:hypothetical protein
MIENFYLKPLLVGRLVHASLERKGLAFEKTTPIKWVSRKLPAR